MRSLIIAAFIIASLAAFFMMGVLSYTIEVSAKILEEKSSEIVVPLNYSQEVIGSMQYLSAQFLPPRPISNLSSLVFVVHPVFIYGVNYTCNRSCWLPGNDVFIEYVLQNGSTIWIHCMSFRFSPVYVVCPSSNFEPLREGYYGAAGSRWLTEPLLPYFPHALPSASEFQATLLCRNASATITVDVATLLSELFQALKANHRPPPPLAEVKISKVMCREAVQILAFAKTPTARLLVLTVEVRGFNPLGYQVEGIVINGTFFKGFTVTLPWTSTVAQPFTVKVFLKSTILPLSLVRELIVQPEF